MIDNIRYTNKDRGNLITMLIATLISLAALYLSMRMMQIDNPARVTAAAVVKRRQ